MSLTFSLQKLVLRNFLSFGNNYTEIDLGVEGSTLVNGENLDTGSANGSGKTTIINAICYALYNKPLDNISLQRLINSTNASKSTLMEVRLTFHKGDDEYEVYRCRGETFNIEVKMNGDDITLDSVSENDKMVLDIIGISYELFTKVVIFSNNTQPFLMLPVSQQRGQIEELFNITMLSEKAVALREKIKRTESDINIQDAIIREQETAITLHERHIKEANDRIAKWDKNRDAEIAEIEEDLKKVEGINFDAEQELHSAKDELTKEIARLKSAIAPVDSEIRTLQKELTKHEGELHHLEEAKCPFCLQAYADAPEKLEELKTKIATKTARFQELKVRSDKLDGEREAAEENLRLITAEIKHTNLKELLNIRTNAVSLQTKLQKLKSDGNPHIDARDSLVAESVKTVDYGRIDELKSFLEHQQFLLKLLTDKNSFIRRRIINKTIPFLNARLNEYTTALGLPHIVKFDADMSCSVSEYGRELDFGNLSNGEKKRVNLAMSLAFRDVLHHLHAKFNVLMVDEIDGGAIDTTGMDLALKLLKRKTRDDEIAVWMITHNPTAAGRLDRDVFVVKENGFSRIEYDRDSAGVPLLTE